MGEITRRISTRPTVVLKLVDQYRYWRWNGGRVKAGKRLEGFTLEALASVAK